MKAFMLVVWVACSHSDHLVRVDDFRSERACEKEAQKERLTGFNARCVVYLID